MLLKFIKKKTEKYRERANTTFYYIGCTKIKTITVLAFGPPNQRWEK